jgi:hypothetical protein
VSSGSQSRGKVGQGDKCHPECQDGAEKVTKLEHLQVKCAVGKRNSKKTSFNFLFYENDPRKSHFIKLKFYYLHFEILCHDASKMLNPEFII